jgi:multicomponent Na+:H+ antiporter subunit C
MSVFPYLVAVWLFVVGLYGIATSKNLIQAIVCLTVL